MTTRGLGVLVVGLALGAALPADALRLGAPIFEAPVGSVHPTLGRAVDGDPAVIWLEPGGEGAARTVAVRFSRRTAGTWSAPVTIHRGPRIHASALDQPRIHEIVPGSWLAVWYANSGEGTHGWHVQAARSTDGGSTWSEPFIPYADRTDCEHGFASVATARGADRAALVWLDARNLETGFFHRGGTSLRYAEIGADGAPGAEVVLDERVCDCCPTDLAMAGSGLVVVYRDRSEEEVRDPSLVRQVDGEWSDPVPLAGDGWETHGCPTNGPAIAARGTEVAVAWYTEARGAPRVRVARSGDGGARFGSPVRVDGGAAVGRVDVALPDGGPVLVSWVEHREDDSELWLARLDASGETVRRKVGRFPAGSIGTPRLLALGREVLLTWAEERPTGRAVVFPVEIGSLGR